MKQIVITGASSGLGKAIKEEIAGEVHDWSLETGIDVTNILLLMQAAKKLPKRVDILINCAGINKLSKIPDITGELWKEMIDVNATSILMVSQVLLRGGRLNNGTICNILSNAAWLPMTASAAYSASKAAATILTRTMARELMQSHGITVFGVAPNRLRGTAMSESVDAQVSAIRGWDEQVVKQQQLASLPAHEETPPEVVASFIAHLLSGKEHHRYLHGTIIPYGGP